MSYQIIYLDNKTACKTISGKNNEGQTLVKSSISKLHKGFAIVSPVCRDKKNIYVDGKNLSDNQLHFDENEVIRLVKLVPNSCLLQQSNEEDNFFVVTGCDKKQRLIPIKIDKNIKVKNAYYVTRWSDKENLILITTNNLFQIPKMLRDYFCKLEVFYHRMERKFG